MTEYGRWAEKTFPLSTPQSLAQRIRDEAVELLLAIKSEDRQALQTEAADVYLLLLHLAQRASFDLDQAAAKKQVINRSRSWIFRDGDYHHVKEGMSKASLDHWEEVARGCEGIGTAAALELIGEVRRLQVAP